MKKLNTVDFLNKSATEIVMDYLVKGWVIASDDTSYGYYFRVTLENNNKKVMVYITKEIEFTFGSSITVYAICIRYNDEKPFYRSEYYTYKQSPFITDNKDEVLKMIETASLRYENRKQKNHSFKPTKKINVSGFKRTNSENITITNISNKHYRIMDEKTRKVKEVKMGL